MVEDPRGSVIIIGGFDGERNSGSPFEFRITRAQVAATCMGVFYSISYSASQSITVWHLGLHQWNMVALVS